MKNAGINSTECERYNEHQKWHTDFIRYGFAIQIVWFMALLLYVAYVGTLVARRTSNVYLRKRSFAIMVYGIFHTGTLLLLSAAGQLLNSESALRCYTTPLFCTYFPIAMVYPKLYRVFRIQKIRIAVQATSANSTSRRRSSRLQSTQKAEGIPRAAKVTIKPSSTTKFFFHYFDVRLVVVASLVSFIGSIIFVAFLPAEMRFVGSTCSSVIYCSMNSVYYNVLIAMWCICQSLVIFLLYRFRGVADIFKIQEELKVLSIISNACFICIVTAISLWSSHHDDLAFDVEPSSGSTVIVDYMEHHFTWSLSMLYMLISTLTLVYPSFLKKLTRAKKRWKKAKMVAAAAEEATVTLKAVVESPLGIKLLREHLTNEYCPETIQFYVDFRAWRDTFLQTDATQRQAEARRLYETYIAAGSELQLNLSEKHRSHVITEFNEARDLGLSVAQDIFNEVFDEVWYGLTDSFGRFKESALFAQYLRESKGGGKKRFVNSSTEASDVPARLHDKDIPIETSFHKAFLGSQWNK